MHWSFRYEKRLNKNFTILLKIYQSQKSNTAIKPNFSISTKEYGRKRLKTDDFGNEADLKHEVDPAKSYDMPIIIK